MYIFVLSIRYIYNWIDIIKKIKKIFAEIKYY